MNYTLRSYNELDGGNNRPWQTGLNCGVHGPTTLFQLLLTIGAWPKVCMTQHIAVNMPWLAFTVWGT